MHIELISSGANLAKAAKDVVLRLGLSIENTRAQTYDKTANMQGNNNSYGALIKIEHPLVQFYESCCSSSL